MNEYAGLPVGRDSPAARALGIATLGLAAAAVLLQLRRARAGKASNAASRLPAAAIVPSSALPSRSLHASASLLAAAVLADSALEHYRGDFENPGMVTPLLTSLMAALAGVFGATSASGRSRMARDGVYASAVAAGAAGSAFHVYNVARRPGGISWGNLFYAAPIGAPAALSLAGLYGLAARRLGDLRNTAGPRLIGLPAGRVLSALTGIGLAGTSAEVGLLHFRGAFQNPFMWLPVTLPPLASALMGAAAARPLSTRLRRRARACLALTGLLGIGGVGFHAYGIGRQMGGWRNWSQNVLCGPPLSAPPAFTALALAGHAALSLIDRNPAQQGARE